MKTGRKGYGEELRIIERYSELSETYFNFLKAKMENGNEEEKWKAVSILKGAFEKMIPQTLNGEFNNNNRNLNADCTPEEAAAVKQALFASVQDTGSTE